jgi:hypothetical protein
MCTLIMCQGKGKKGRQHGKNGVNSLKFGKRIEDLCCKLQGIFDRKECGLFYDSRFKFARLAVASHMQRQGLGTYMMLNAMFRQFD